jgi:aryl-alcohol dehydrogenase-like predicted oxidoreductase
MALDSYITLGRSGLRVSPFSLGTMTFGEDHGWGTTPAESETILADYLDRGGNSVDTANIYTNGHSEKIVGDFFAARPGLRDRVVVGTKFFSNLYPGDPNGGGAGRKAIVQQLEQSLRRLQMDHVDVYWLHNWDQGAPIEETLRTLDDLVTAGKIRYIGLSDVPAWVAADAQAVARFRGWAPIVALQLEYSLLERTSEGELIPMAQASGMGVMPWSPRRRGRRAGPWARAKAGAGSVDTGRAHIVGAPSERDWVVIDALNAVASELGVKPAVAALAWVQSRPGVASTLIGARRLDQFHTNLTALDVTLTDAQVAALEEASAPALNFPAANNRDLAPMLGFGGVTVDGQTIPANPMLEGSATRY